MNFDKIVNPETGRKVNTKGKIGQKIIRNYIKHFQKKYKESKNKKQTR